MNPIGGISLFNALGRIDIGRHFAPFGLQPQRGSYLLAGSPEFLTQRPESALLRIEWENLPSDFDFARYYVSYGVPVTNSSFQVSASFLCDAQCHPLRLQDPSLFRVLAGSPSLISEFHLDLPTLAEEPHTTDGFLRLELTAPAFGFGASLYAQAISATVLRNAYGENLPLPQIPFTPLASGVSIFLSPAK